MEIHRCCVWIYLIWWIFYSYVRLLEEIHKLMVPAKWESTFKKIGKAKSYQIDTIHNGSYWCVEPFLSFWGSKAAGLNYKFLCFLVSPGHIFAFFATLRKGIWGTPKGPLGHPEVATVGLDDLQQRCQQAGCSKRSKPMKWR